MNNLKWIHLLLALNPAFGDSFWLYGILALKESIWIMIVFIANIKNWFLLLLWFYLSYFAIIFLNITVFDSV